MKKLLNIIIVILLSSFLCTLSCYADNTSKIIYVDVINGDDITGNGLTSYTAVKTLKKAYELLSSGGSIYIVNTIEITLTDTQYKAKNDIISLRENARIEEIKRYSQPTAYESLTGFEKDTNLNTLIFITAAENLTIENLLIDGVNLYSNTATTSGGAILIIGKETAKNSNFYNNTATQGGAL